MHTYIMMAAAMSRWRQRLGNDDDPDDHNLASVCRYLPSVIDSIRLASVTSFDKQ